jgi:MFS family permease
VPGAIGALLVLTVKEIAAPARTGPPPLLLSLKGYDRRFRLFLLVTFAFAIGNSSDVFLILRARDLGLSATAAILAYVVYNCTYAGLSLPAGIRSDRIDRRWLLGAGFVIFAVVYASFALTDRAWTVWPLFAIYGSYIAMTEGVGKAYVSDLVPDEQRATAMGLYNALTGGAILFASVLGGALWDLVGPSATFAFGAGMALVAAALLAMTATEQPSRTRFR